MASSCSILALMVLIYSSLFNSLTCSSNRTDYLSLLVFKSAIHDPLGALNSWNETTQFCSWEGIRCSRRHPDRLVGINLMSKGLVGSLSPSIGNMSFLQVLDLKNNSFHGIIPSEIGFLRRLTFVEFSNNSFTGVIPRNLSKCSNLVYLNLIDNHLSGIIPPELGSLYKLKALGLSKNNLSGNIPPSIGNLTSLVMLFMPFCGLTGVIPDSLGQLRNVKRIILSFNSLGGTIPPVIFNISAITDFEVRGNQLRGLIPSTMGLTLPNLVYLNLGFNLFSGAVPTSLANASLLERIAIHRNHFSGRMPMLGSLSYLRFLLITSNRIEDDDSFISSLTNCTNLESLEISDNLISGALPESIANFSSNFSYLEIAGTQVRGSIPLGIGNLVGLSFLSMFDNNLEGTIPPTIGGLYNMQELYLSGNKFTNELPYSLGNMTSLSRMSLRRNRLLGSLPKSLVHCKKLLSLDLSENNFSGPIPKEIMSVSSLSILLDLSFNALTDQIPSEIGLLTHLSSLDLSNNRLVGGIPSSLSGCTSLEQLLLEGNLFEGDIPPGLSALKGLRNLDLSQNHFSGLIPSFLGELKLERLNLSFNRLRGEVSKLGVFANQSSISLEGNTELCGGILPLKLPPCTLPNSPNKNLSILLKILIPVGVVFFLCLVIFLYKKIKSKQDLPSSLAFGSAQQFPRFTYVDLLKATSEFSEDNLVGVGRFGSVYKGILGDGQTLIAVKVLNLLVEGASKSFLKECEALRHKRHRNLLKILSVCESIDFNGNNFKALVYEFKSNASLERWLYPDAKSDKEIDGKACKLDIIQRLNIAIDIAHALEYLHCGTESIVVHGDLKPNNILLDDDMTACVGDFGLAKVVAPLISRHDSSSSIGITGTIGYVPPEYGMSNVISTDGDVYSYGILLLEIFTNRRPTDSLFNDHLDLHNFVIAALPDCIEKIVDPLVGIGHDMKDEKIKGLIVSVLNIGVVCSKANPKDRMPMTEVVHELCRIKDSYLVKM